MRKGNFYHNCEVLQLRNLELILLRRPTPFEQKKYTYINYGPCPDCLGCMLKKNIAFHIKNNCGIKSKVGLENRKPIGESNAMLSGMFGFNFTSEFTSNILTRMRDDEITKVCKEDQLILKFGFMMFEKYSTTQCELIRQSMRQIGRFFKEVNKARPDIKSLSECLKPQHFDVIIQATKTLCVTNTNIAKSTEFQTPSLALKIGHALKKCISYERGNALRSGNIKRNRDLEAFLSLMDMEWSTRISSNALNTLHTRKFNCTQLLPITSDLIKLNNYLECEMKKHKTEIEKTYQPSLSCWSRFASLMLSKIVVFNKKRSGETSRMTLEQYSMRPLWSEQTTEESKSAMTQFEKQLAEHFAVVEVPGKRDLPHIELEDGEEVDENAVREDKPNNVPFSEEESTPNNIEEENVPNTTRHRNLIFFEKFKLDKIESFRRSKTVWNGKIEDTSLFYFWKTLKHLSSATLGDRENQICNASGDVVEESSNVFLSEHDIPSLNISDVTNYDISTNDIDVNAILNAPILFENELAPITIRGNVSPKRRNGTNNMININDLSDVNEIILGDDLVSITTNENISERPTSHKIKCTNDTIKKLMIESVPTTTKDLNNSGVVNVIGDEKLNTEEQSVPITTSEKLFDRTPLKDVNSNQENLSIPTPFKRALFWTLSQDKKQI
ncbi:hypothetical protein RN001_005788 [Aquatica leii]|uniref:Uncharacterized protein n=1 Tax=Aquatica leii TaxID=1421715 RepID=A0AAN7Q0S6_9COLE|nr:hypothetical protein RN001_005788 [Aquatica leii]